MNVIPIRRTAPPEPNGAVRPDVSGMLFRRTRSWRWTNKFPEYAGYYAIRPKDHPLNRTIFFIEDGLNPEQFTDAEFSNLPVRWPLEADDPDDKEDTWNRSSICLLEHVDESTELDHERTQLWLGIAIGSMITIVVMLFTLWAMYHH